MPSGLWPQAWITPSPLCTGAWYFYPYGLHTFQPAMVSWWAAKGGPRQHDVWESGDSPHFQVSLVGSRVLTLPVCAVGFSGLTPYLGGVLAGGLPCPCSLLFGGGRARTGGRVCLCSDGTPDRPKVRCHLKHKQTNKKPRRKRNWANHCVFYVPFQ